MTLATGEGGTNPTMGPGGAEGSYSVSDFGCRGDQYAVSPRPFPVPGYLQMYDDLRKALRVSVDTCELQNGVCWVLRANQLHQRCGQACEGGCPTPGPVRVATPLAGLGTTPGWERGRGVERRATQRSWHGWDTVARVSPQGIALTVAPGCVLPLWQRIYYVGGEQNDFARDKPGMTYQAAVEAARYLARTQGRPRVVSGRLDDGRIVPVVYVQPGGVARAVPRARGPATNVYLMSELDRQQAVAAAQGASVLPYGM